MAKRNPAQKCNNCRWGNPTDPGPPPKGECRRYPPKRIVIWDHDRARFVDQTVYPVLDREDWCGEWESD
jgi:hypothetical protein